MWHYPIIDPVAIDLGFVQVHWYGISYLVGFAIAWGLARLRARRHARWNDEQVADLLFYGALGAVIGGRLGFVLFYGLGFWAQDVWYPLRVWDGGMSFHGGLLGVGVAMALFARRHGKSWFEVTDFMAPTVPPGLGMGRIGNFVNAELPGRVAEVPWALIYPGETVARHPSSLYQAMLEGLLLFAVVWLFSSKPRPAMSVTGVFLATYGVLRTFSEFFRQPDAHMGDGGFVAFGWVTMGQSLSLPMVLLGLALIILAMRHGQRSASTGH